MEVLYRQIEIALAMEELVDALDVIDTGVRTRHQQLEELLVTDLTIDTKEDPSVAGWDDPAQVEYRKEVLGQVVIRSLFIASWSILEQLLSNLSSDFKQDLGLRLSERELGGRGVERSMKYIRKVAGLEIDLDASAWPEITQYRKLRNHLVHAGSNADDGRNPSTIRAACEKLPGARVEPAGEIVLEIEFVEGLIRSMQRLLHGITDEMVRESS